MIKQLRNRFIIVAMCSTIAVLAIIIGLLNIVSYQNVIAKTDSILEMLSSNDARFPDSMFGKAKGIRGGMSPETPYETRFFSVRFTKSGEVIAVDTGKIAAIETKEAVRSAREILNAGSDKGFFGNYRYLIEKDAREDVIIVVDATRELTSFRIQLEASLFISLIGILAVFVLILIFSKRVFAPVADSYEKQKRFITDASHELKTPLTIISANAEVLEMEQEENPWTISIKNQVERMTGLVEQMVTLSRMDESEELSNQSEVNLSDILSETVDLFSPVIAAQKKQLEVNIEKDCIYQCDEKLIRQMLSLLLDNAVKYSDEQGHIVITLKQKGKHKEIRLENTVNEVPKGNLNRLFERFYRLDSSRSNETGGSGIGLSIVKSIVELHKGKITAKSEDGKSIEFTVLL